MDSTDIYANNPDDDSNFNKDDFAESLKACTVIKSAGVALFRNSDLPESLNKFMKSLKYCNELMPTDSSISPLYTGFLNLKKSLFLNVSLIYLKQNKYHESIKYCNYLIELKESYPDFDQTVSEKDLTKCYYRLGKNYLNLKKYDQSLKYLLKANNLDPIDKLIKSDLQNCQSIITRQRENEKSKYSKFFN
ncbi:tetratricopeptide repeat protein ASCRUDRAFT_8193 [Ascoidea rubescens DSM 1968]|uniref:Uncharacterized protein n=1 Tax=Ascoidea rubescens DSM 1968 TaxID=1344418 RepID=A0A1D2VIE6_9ASCO|nr:hypothetical protein ASCRUDRAFT_8193 [Ascoidea rubescens DSM 1968]ODV61263.1 hypothetical protein ASCRUDRAFT_8193 [Ascoidea rubescens DSM 1968]